MKYVEPYNNNHAIKGVAFAIEFIEELAEKDFRNAINLYNTKLESNFKEPIEHEGFTIKIDEQGRQVSNNTLSGISFNSKDDVWSVQLRQNALIVTSNVYTRWADMWIQTKAYFEKFCEILSEKKVSLIAMEYIDEYNISNINSDWKNYKINNKIEKETNYLALINYLKYKIYFNKHVQINLKYNKNDFNNHFYNELNNYNNNSLINYYLFLNDENEHKLFPDIFNYFISLNHIKE